ncbi:MAG TPA: glycosyltransferase family 4 protein [Balneolaceae bacterium]
MAKTSGVKTLYIISKGIDKLSDEEIKRREEKNMHPRSSKLEEALSAEVLDERYLSQKVPAIRRRIYKFFPVELAQVIETLIIHKKYDAIYSESERVGFPLALVMKFLRIKTPHTMVIARITSMNEKREKQKKWFLEQTKETVDLFIFWSSVQRNIAVNELGVSPEKAKWIRRGIDQRFWHPVNTETDMICSAGMEMRDYPTLVEALRSLDIPCHFAVGTARGQIFETVQRLYNVDRMPENITVGKKSYRELRKLYARSRFVVVALLPTDSDNGLTTILEAMAMGKAVICSRTEGQIDVIKEGETGIYVPAGDPAALRNAIIELWNDPALAERMGKKGRERIEKYFRVEEFAADIRDEVSRVVNESRVLKTARA